MNYTMSGCKANYNNYRSFGLWLKLKLGLSTELLWLDGIFDQLFWFNEGKILAIMLIRYNIDLKYDRFLCLGPNT